MKKIISISFLLLIIVPIVYLIFYRLTMGFFPQSIGTRHTLNMMTRPNDLYNPIVLDSFNLNEQGLSRSYELHPKYLDFYIVGIRRKNLDANSNEPFSALAKKYSYNGEVLIEILLYEKVLLSQKVSSSQEVWQSDDRQSVCIALLKFEIPIQGKYKDDLQLRITALKSDPQIEQIKETPELFVQVSSIP